MNRGGSPRRRAADPILLRLEAALVATTAGDLDLARAHLVALDLDYARDLRRAKLASVAGAVRAAAVSPDLRSKRGSIPSATKRAIFERDRYTCRLCGMRTIDLDVLKALSRAFPVELPFHPGWRQDVASPIYWTHSTSLEHVVPIARGGADDETNFATSCYACNEARVDYLLEELGWKLSLREMWKSAGVWVESKSAAWSEVEGEVEGVAEVAPDHGDPAGE